MERDPPSRKGPFKADVYVGRGAGEQVYYTLHSDSPALVEQKLKEFRHGDFDASPFGPFYNIMINSELRKVDSTFMEHLGLEVTELIADPITFYYRQQHVVRRLHLSASAHGPILAAGARSPTTLVQSTMADASGQEPEALDNVLRSSGEPLSEGRPVTTRRPIVYIYETGKFYIRADWKWLPLDAEAYLHDSDAAATAAAAAAEDVK